LGIRLVVRRLRGAKTLVLAAAGVTLVATAFLAGLVDYSRSVVAAGAANSIASSPAAERSLLVRGSAGTTSADLAKRDEAVRAETARVLAGTDARVVAAGYATGRQLTGDTGDATSGEDGLIFASIVFADGLRQEAELVAGAWPLPGQQPVQTALAAPVAAVIGADVGERIQITDRLTDTVSELAVTGIWQPRDLSDPYWRLFPEVERGVADQSSTYGPFVVDRADFVERFLGTASAGWLIDVDLSSVDLPALQSLARRTIALGQGLPAAAGLGSSGLASTGMGDLADRLRRADLVGRSALLTPLLLVVVLGGYALLLIALLLNEHRRAETALMRARGAARAQIAGLASREAALVVLPAAVLAPFVAAAALDYSRRVPALAVLGLPPADSLGEVAWLVAGAAALACAVAMIVPALRRSGTYVEELASRSRPSRWAFAQRAAVDVALVAFAAVAWIQLRQHASPLSGAGEGLGIDPLLGAAPTVAVLAGALVGLRLLPGATRLAERRVSRTRWNATVLGLWQAGRRPHAGPVLLLSLAVAVSTLALCLASTAEQSLLDQADYRVGADLRVVEADNTSPETRGAELAAIPGVRTALPAVRDVVPVGPQGFPASVLAIDAGKAPEVVKLRSDLAGGSSPSLFGSLADSRIGSPTIDLGPDSTRLQGRVETKTDYEVGFAPPVRTSVVLLDSYGAHQVVPVGVTSDGSPLTFDVELPESLRPAKVVGFVAEILGYGYSITWKITGLGAVAAGGTVTPVDVDNLTWRMTRPGIRPLNVAAVGDTLEAMAGPGVLTAFSTAALRLTVVPVREATVLKGYATPGVLAALKAEVGDEIRVALRGAPLQVEIIGTIGGIPGASSPDGILLDLPTLSSVLLSDFGTVQRAQEWWVSVDPAHSVAAARDAAALPGVRVLDRRALAEDAGQEPYGAGARAALWAAAGGAVLLALVGIAVDVRATARRRLGEFAVLRTLGAGSGLLSRALLTEQAVLAGLGVVSGLLVGIGVAATMAPLVILTPSAGRPEPAALISVPWLPVSGAAVGLLGVSLVLAALVALSMRQRLVATQLRIGEDR
jgi:hypothetical protein